MKQLPETSITAYRHVQRRKGRKLREIVLEYIKDRPGTNQREISLKFGESARKRVSELIGPNVGDLIEMDMLCVMPETGLKYKMYRVREKGDL